VKLKYAVIGTGACGGVLGCRLLGAGCDVYFLARSEYAHLQSNGMEILDGTLSASKFPHVSVYKSIGKMPKCDVILLAVKGYDNPTVSPQLRNILKPESIIVIFQNGLGIEKELARLYPDIRQILTVSWLKVTRLAPGSYRHDFGVLVQGIGYLGRDDVYCSEPTSLEERVIEDFARAGLRLQFDTNFFSKQWTKLALNIPLFILTIKYNISSDQALTNEEYNSELALLRAEIQRIAMAYSISIDAELITQVDEQLRESESHTYPSMKVDYDNKKELELETIFCNRSRHLPP